MFPNKIEGPVIAVGDVHGSYGQVKALLNFVNDRDRWVVFLGDFVDGPDTAKTIDLLLTLNQTTFLCGNHDLNLAKALGIVASPHQGYYQCRVPTRNAQTLASYGAKDAAELCQRMPASHKEFLANLPWCVEHPDYLFVHAGLDSHQPYADQIARLRQRDTATFKPKWLYDNRLAFCAPQDTNKIIVSGHTILRHAIITHRRILLDTGCGYGGPLTACLSPERILIQVPFTKEVS